MDKHTDGTTRRDTDKHPVSPELRHRASGQARTQKSTGQHKPRQTNDGRLIPKHGGYENTKTWQLADLIYDVTVRVDFPMPVRGVPVVPCGLRRQRRAFTAEHLHSPDPKSKWTRKPKPSRRKADLPSGSTGGARNAATWGTIEDALLPSARFLH